MESFHIDTPNVSFSEYCDVQSIEGYPTESFFQLEIPAKQRRIEFSKLSRKVVSCHGNIHQDWLLELNFSEWKYHRKKGPKAENPKWKPLSRYPVVLVRGHNVPPLMSPLAWIGLRLLAKNLRCCSKQQRRKKETNVKVNYYYY